MTEQQLTYNPSESIVVKRYRDPDLDEWKEMTFVTKTVKCPTCGTVKTRKILYDWATCSCYKCWSDIALC